MSVDGVLTFIGLLGWGYLAGCLLAAVIDHGPVHVPLITPAILFLSGHIERLVWIYQRWTNTLAAVIERGVNVSLRAVERGIRKITP